MLRKQLIKDILIVFLLTATGFLVMGYHPGFEDDGIYLSAVKLQLNPTLYPHDSEFIRLQMQATVFDDLIAQSVHWTKLPVVWSELLWQFAALFLILWASRQIAARLFRQVHAQWSGVAMVAAMLTLPVAGTALNIADQHLHPRNLATALILCAISFVFNEENRRWIAVPLLVAAFAIHPIMGAFGISFCLFLLLALRAANSLPLATRAPLAAAVPLGWLFAPDTPSWRAALASRSYYSVYHWAWYEWLGAIMPLVLFGLLWQATRGRTSAEGEPTDEKLAPFAQAVFAYGIFQLAIAMAIQAPAAFARLMTLQPMRFLQLVYIFMALVGGGLLGQFVLEAKIWRWTAYLLLINGSMFLVQWKCIDEGTHLELPTTAITNPWLQAFAWVKENTPTDAYFALDPRYLAVPGEGFHSFRALAERSQLADGIKDTAVAMEVPSLAPVWQEQQAALAGWSHFQRADFERLKAQFGVNWVLVSNPATDGLDCQWHNASIAVCRIP